MTAKFQVPKPGKTITLTTRYPDYYYYSDKEWKDTTYENVEVLKPERWLKSNQFMVTGDAKMPVRVIDIKNVIAITDGERGSSDVQTVEIQGSKGSTYHVTFEGGHAVSCTCPGFQFRKTCRHLKEAETLLVDTQAELG